MTAAVTSRANAAALILVSGSILMAADIAPEIAQNPTPPGPTGSVRLIAGPSYSSIDERIQTTAPGTAPQDSAAKTHADGWRAAVQAVSPLDPERDTGWCYGGELGLGRTGWTRANTSIALRLITLDALFGYSGRIASGLRWEATPFAGAGIARWQVSDPTQSIPTTRALYLEAGLRAGLTWTWDIGLQVAVEARVSQASTRTWISRQDYSGATSTVHDRARITSTALLGGLGWNF